MYDRFDFEQELMNLWNIVEDIKTITYMLENYSEDEVSNALNGVASLYNARFSKVHDMFEQLVQERKIV